MKYTKVYEADDVTDEILSAAEETEGWYTDDPIPWDDFWDRLDGYYLKDGSLIDMGPTLNSSAMRKIKRHILSLRKGN